MFFDSQTYPLWHLVGRALLHSLWQGILVAGLLGVALSVLRGRAAHVRYAAACAALALMLVFPLATAWQLGGAAEGVPLGEEAAAVEIGDESSVAPAARVSGAAAAGASTSAGEVVAESGAAREGLESLLPWLTLLWLAGVSLLSARTLCGLIYTRRLRSEGVRPLGEQFEERAREIARRLRVTRPVRFVESSLVRVPTVVGWLRPAVLMPASALTGLTPRQLETILAHELAHIRRHDYLFNLLQTVVETILFYHPAAWWVSRQVRNEREHVCDDLVVNLTGDALTYARALTKMERLRRSAPALTLAADGGQLRSRVLRLVESKPHGRRPPTFAVGAVFVVALLTTFACTRAVLSQKESGERPAPTLAKAETPAVAQAAPGASEQPQARANPLTAGDQTEGEDAEVRRVAVEALGGRAGTVVVMHPQTGRVYAVVNQDWALRRGWAPASTMKLVTSLAGLGEKLFDPSERVRVSGRTERLDLAAALAFSDNEYFRALGPRVGAERILEYGRRLGLGEPTGINYEGEYAGRLPSARTASGGASVGFGEGVEVTPVQLAVLVSALANGGTLVAPRVPRTPGEADGFQPQPGRRLDIPTDVLEQVVPGLVAAVERGSASTIKDPSLKVAGKTGTMAGKNRSESTGIFASYAPADRPRLAVVVLTRGEKENGPGAARIAGNIYKALRARLSAD